MTTVLLSVMALAFISCKLSLPFKKAPKLEVTVEDRVWFDIVNADPNDVKITGITINNEYHLYPGLARIPGLESPSLPVILKMGGSLRISFLDFGSMVNGQFEQMSVQALLIEIETDDGSASKFHFEPR